MSEPVVKQLAAKIQVDPSGCHIWEGAICDGYGYFYFKNKSRRVHKMIYEMIVGPVPASLVLDHLCRNRRCVNPEHLEPVTHTENVRLGISYEASKTHCPHGHEYNPCNTILILRKNGKKQRQCRVCKKARDRQQYLKRMGRAA